MAYTIAQEEDSFISKIKPVLNYLALFIILGGIAYGVTIGMQYIPGMKREAALTVQVQNGTAKVFVDKEEIGETPMSQNKIKPGTYDVRIQDLDDISISYSSKIEFNPGVETTIHRDLGVSDLFSSGKTFSMERGETGPTVISQPSDATILLDGTEMGKTPTTLTKITEGNYVLSVRKTGYESQEAQIKIDNGYKLTVSAKLFPIPVPGNIQKFADSKNLYDLTINNESITNSPDRARAIVYWNSTRGLGISGEIEYYIDQGGNAYNGLGELITTLEELETLKDAEESGAYLGSGTSTPGLTEAAKETYLSLTEGKQTGTILPTGVGWLRVRKTPSLGGEELAKVNVGETFSVLEIQANWVKIKLTDGKTGWVSDTYIKVSQ